MTGVMDPSCITGINDLPKNTNPTKLKPKAIKDRFTTNLGLARHQCNQGS